MQLDIQARGFELTDSLRRHIERRINFAFNFADQRIQWVEVTLGDENGPRGGVDQFCQIQVKVPGMPVIVNRQKSSELYAAIDVAVYCASRTLTRRFKRQQCHSQQKRAASQMRRRAL